MIAEQLDSEMGVLGMVGNTAVMVGAASVSAAHALKPIMPAMENIKINTIRFMVT